MFIEILLAKIIKEFLAIVKEVSLGIKKKAYWLKNNMDNQLFERCFIVTACEYGVKQYGSIMSYAKKIWPEKDDKNAAQTLYAIQKKSSKTGKPQGLPLHLAVLMVDLLQDAPSFPSFCFEIAEKIRLGWGLEMHMDNYISIGGCVLLQKVGNLPKFEIPLCPECKKPLLANNDDYLCPLCKYSTSKRQTDEALSRHKARYGKK